MQKYRNTIFRLIAFCTVILWKPFPTAAQSNKYISQFSHFQSYFNPGLTGYEGSTVRAFVRNQWSGVSGAPKTYFLSAEFDFGEFSDADNPALKGKNAMGLNLLFDTYGAFRETELMINYASRIRISDQHNLRLGTGINFQTIQLDGNALTTDQLNDETVGQYYGSFANMTIYDFNLGIALSHHQYYISYGMHNVNAGKVSKGDDFIEGKPIIYMAQAGARGKISEYTALIGNFFYRKQKNLPDHIEFNSKVLFYNALWVGAGHRIDRASSFQLGFVQNSFRLGYIYEIPNKASHVAMGNTHELMMVWRIFQGNQAAESKLNMW